MHQDRLSAIDGFQQDAEIIVDLLHAYASLERMVVVAQYGFGIVASHPVFHARNGLFNPWGYGRVD